MPSESAPTRLDLICTAIIESRDLMLSDAEAVERVLRAAVEWREAVAVRGNSAGRRRSRPWQQPRSWRISIDNSPLPWTPYSQRVGDG